MYVFRPCLHFFWNLKDYLFNITEILIKGKEGPVKTFYNGCPKIHSEFAFAANCADSDGNQQKKNVS